MAKTALVTGASGGIGADIARRLAKEGCHLILVARREEKLQELQNELKEKFGTVSHLIPMDLSQPGACHDLYNQVKEKELEVNILINNAGCGLVGDFQELSLETQENMVQLNVNCLMSLTHLFGADMKARKSGRIMNIASVVGFFPAPLMAVYAATKAFVLSFSEAIYQEYLDHGVLVSAICPGTTRSDFFDNAGFGENNRHVGMAMSSKVVADQAVEAMLQGRRRHTTGIRNKILVALTWLIPNQIILAATRIVNKKGSPGY